MAASSPIPGPSPDGTFGPLEIGTTTGTYLFGILTLQTFNYYAQFPQDSKLFRITTKTYWVTVTTYGRPPSAFIMKPPPSLIGTLVFSGSIDALVQVHIPTYISGEGLRGSLRFICDTALMLNIWQEVLQEMLLSPSPCATTCGIFGNPDPNSIVRPLVYVVFTTDRPQVLARTDLAFAVFYLIQPKLFSNSMLAVLNGRARFRSAEDLEQNTGSGLMFNSARTRERRGASAPSAHVVDIQLSPIPENTEVVSPKSQTKFQAGAGLHAFPNLIGSNYTAVTSDGKIHQESVLAQHKA
ncbi:hypothetical protein B0H17DRAFT_1183666 [Mycena rosella]|uniref:Uncharacterized protein n=1 Tax=Mycena rosella TaxID=1033263 RepID=A0AAD7D2V8_MYCRO|nr:hypothetical protein B0H17DRAFT_1183666 [Mycena rosella]